MIKLMRLVPKHIREAVDLPPPVVQFVQPTSAHIHAYSKPAGDHAGKQYYQGNIDFTHGKTDGALVSKAGEVIKRFENSKDNPRGGFDKNRKKWFPHRSIEGGTATIAYGHKMKQGEDFREGLTDSEAVDLLHKDIKEKHDLAKTKIRNFDSLPITIKIATINALYRGDLGPKTMTLLAQNQFDKAAKEYLNHQEYRSTKNTGVKKCMEWNAKVFQGAA
jgi:hypothetical protein